MHVIVSLLDDQHIEFVEKLWAEMAQRFGVGIWGQLNSFFTTQVISEYNKSNQSID